MVNRFSRARHFAVSVTSTSSAALAENSGRRFALFQNDSDTVMYLQLGTADAVADTGIRVNANGGEFELAGDNLWCGSVSAICAGTVVKTLLVTEGDY